MTTWNHHSRGLLHATKLGAFTAYALACGYRSEETRGPHEVLRLRAPTVARRVLLIFHRRQDGEHVTVPDGAGDLVRDFLTHDRETTESAPSSAEKESRDGPRRYHPGREAC